MNKNFILLREDITKRAQICVGNAFKEGKHEVIIRPYKVNRSTQQNQYYWKIITIIADDVGTTKDDMHQTYKEMFLMPIMCRDDKDYAKMIADIHSVNKDYRENLTRQVVRLTSTTKLNTKQFSEFLDDVTHHAISLGIRLPQEGV